MLIHTFLDIIMVIPWDMNRERGIALGVQRQKKIQKAYIDGCNDTLNHIEQSFKLHGIGPKTQEKIMAAVKDLATKKWRGEING